MGKKIKIVFEDEWMVVVDKPAGMVVNNAQTVKEQTVQMWFTGKYPIFNIQNSIKGSEFYEKQGIVHRLDKDTSGLLVLAKTPEAYEKLKDQFLKRRVEKKYLALVHGKLKTEAGVISLPIVRHPKIWGKFWVGEDLSKTAVTEWKTSKVYMKNNSQFSMLEAAPLTGRTHQIRVHLKHLGHPIVSDPLYLGKKQLCEDLVWCPRLFLHASKIRLTHPITGENNSYECRLPGELELALARLS